MRWLSNVFRTRAVTPAFMIINYDNIYVYFTQSRTPVEVEFAIRSVSS